MLSGKVAWVTGGGSGIGLAGAEELVKAGARVVISGRTEKTNREAEKKLKALGDAEAVQLEVSDKKAVYAVAADIEKRHGRIDILVTSAGTNIAGNARNFRNMTPEGWDEVVRINLDGLFYCCHAVIPGMRKRKDGLIMNISSWAGRYASSLTGPAYNATKRAVIAISESINMEECMHGIRACSILPGEVATPIMRKRPVMPSPEEMARMAQPEDFGKAILFVATMPARTTVNELVIAPTWNRFYVGGLEAPKNLIFWRVTLPFLAGYFVSYIYRSINAIIGPELVREFGLTAAGLGLLSGIYFFAFALFQLPLGVLLDRYGPRRVNATLLMVAACGGLWFALAGSAAELTLARALIGLGVSGCLMSSFSAFALWYPPERLATMNGIAFASGMLGAIMVTVPLEFVLRTLHWREVFHGIVAATVAVSLILYFVVPEKAAARRAPPLPAQLREFAALARDAAFWRIALCIGSSQLAAVSLGTLWIATWLRDVAGYTQAEVAQALLLFNILMIAGYLGFGRVADRLTRGGRSTLPLLAGGVALASMCLALLVAGVRTGNLVLWALFFGCSTSVVLSYSLFSRRYPKEMAGRVNSALNVSVFIGMFSGQWAVGLVLNRWPPTATGYAPEAYAWAVGGLWLVQFAGVVWLWSGRRLFNQYDIKP